MLLPLDVLPALDWVSFSTTEAVYEITAGPLDGLHLVIRGSGFRWPLLPDPVLPDSGTITHLDLRAFAAAIISNTRWVLDGLSVQTPDFTTAAVGGLRSLLMAGADRLDGGIGAHNRGGFEGADVMRGSAGADALSGGDGDDTINGEDGAETISGGAGNDMIEGSTGRDTLRGGDDDDDDEDALESVCEHDHVWRSLRIVRRTEAGRRNASAVSERLTI